jgi:hypothetical protein
MPSDREQFALEDLDINDGVLFDLEDLGFKAATPKPALASNPAADGDLLIEEPHFNNAEFNPRVRIVPQVDMDTALEAHGLILDKLQKAGRSEGGLPIPWTPAGSTRQYTAWALLGEIADLPITPTGDLAGWFINSPVLQFKLTCQPFLERPERQVLAPVESAGPLHQVFIPDIDGDVPAAARAFFTDKAGQTRQHLEWGQEILEEEFGADLLIDSDDLTAVAGAAHTHVGAGEVHDPNSFGANVIKATLQPSAITIAKTKDLAHVGSFRLKARAFAAAGASFQALCQVGDGALRAVRQDWVEAPIADAPCEIDLGEVDMEQLPEQTQRSEIRILGKGTSKVAAEIDYLLLIPTRRYGIARAPAVHETPGALVAEDSFDQTAGALTGKEAPLGGKWEGSGDADDFQVTGSGSVQRTAVSDAIATGRNAFLSGASYTNITVQGRLSIPAPSSPNYYRLHGVQARYTATTKKVIAALQANPASSGSWTAYVFLKDTNTSIGFGTLPFDVAGQDVDIRLQVNADGRWRLWVNGTQIKAGQDSRLATGGEMATGKIGLYDENGPATAATRLYREFFAFVPTIRAVCFSGRKVEISSERQQRQAEAGGTVWGEVPFYRGGGLYLDPAGDAGAVNRVVAKLRRGDLETDQDVGIADKAQLEIWATERFLAPR